MFLHCEAKRVPVIDSHRINHLKTIYIIHFAGYDIKLNKFGLDKIILIIWK